MLRVQPPQLVPQLEPQQLFTAGLTSTTAAFVSQQPGRQTSQQGSSQQPVSQHSTGQHGQHGSWATGLAPTALPIDMQRNQGRTV